MTCEEIITFGTPVSRCSGEWECPCPQCGHPSHLHVNTQKGVYTCVTPGCGYGGNFSGQRMVSAPKAAPDWKLNIRVFSEMMSVGNLSDRHKNWLYHRGIQAREDNPSGLRAISTDGVVDILSSKFSLSELQRAGFKDDLGIPTGWLGYDRVIIPYFTENGTYCYYARSRVASHSDRMKYLAPPGIASAGVSWGWELVPPGCEVLGVTEGELKAQAARQSGVPCVALPGMGAGHQALAKRCAKVGIKKVVIVFDTEMGLSPRGDPKQGMVDQAAHRLGRTLWDYGVQYRVRWLPHLDEMKMDIDSYILRQGPQAFVDWFQEGTA